MPITALSMFSSISPDVAGDKRLAHDVLNLKVNLGRAGISPIAGNVEVDSINSSGATFNILEIDPSDYGRTGGIILAVQDNTAGVTVGEYGDIINLFFWEDPFGRTFAERAES